MNQGIKLRQKIHSILLDIFKYGNSVEMTYKKYSINNLSKRDRAFINNVSLNSMRFYFHTYKIIKKFTKKVPGLQERILLVSSITQIVFLDFKSYAVINSSVEVAKSNNIYHNFINAILNKISKQKKLLKEVKVNFTDFPLWFIKLTNNISKNEKNEFLINFKNEPHLHLVFKNKRYLDKFEHKINATSEKSGFMSEKIDFETSKSFINGEWWVQDFSSFYPLNIIDKNIIKQPCIDICSAPGGKSFQILSINKDIVLNDISKERIKILKNNLKRLNYKPRILNLDFKNLSIKEKYNFIILDAPCSAVGTVRRHPEILFRKSPPNISNLITIQKNMLDKCASILNKNGIILYMVCSFLKAETLDQVNKFLLRNKNFSVLKFSKNKNVTHYNNFIKDNLMLTLPSTIMGYNIDGYFAVYLKRDK